MGQRRLFPKILVLIFSALISLLLLEMACRVYFFGWSAFSFSRMNSVHSLGVSGLIRPTSVPDILYELRPSLDTFFKLKGFKTNAEGLRNGEYRLRKPPGTFRVAVLGDSLTMGSGVDITDAYHSVLEKRLSERDPERRFEFINFGTGGYSLRQYVAVLERKALSYDPDLVLIGFSRNDDIIAKDSDHQGPYRVKERTNPFFHIYLTDWIKMNRLYRRFERKKAKKARGRRASKGSTTEQRRAYVEKHFGKLRTVSERERVPVVVAYVSLVGKKAEPVREIAEKEGLYFVDASAPFRDRNVRDYWIYRLDSHPNAAANRIFADVIGSYLTEKGLLGEDPPLPEKGDD